MANCRICNAGTLPFISFGKMPIANGFLSREEFANEFFFELGAAFCPSCTMVQLTEVVERSRLFHDRYPFYSSSSTRMAEHFQHLATHVSRRYLAKTDPFVVEIGSNDGILLRHFARSGVRHLGIEPSSNVAAAARRDGVDTIERFFDASLATEIAEGNGKADVILAANVMCHMADLHSVVVGITNLLASEGVLIFEDPYLGDIVGKTAYDQIYDEHVFYFSRMSLQNLFNRHGLEIFDVEPQPVHGGSMRFYVGHRGIHSISDRVRTLEHQERERGLGKFETFERLRERIEQSRDALMNLLVDLESRNKRVAGYGATSKSTTVINHCGITTELIEYISDTTPIKQGKYSPGMHIPIRSPADFEASFPDYAVMFAWNHRDEVQAKNAAFREANGKWILYVPVVHILE